MTDDDRRPALPVHVLMSDGDRLVEDNPDAPGIRRFIPSLWPDPTTINDGIRSDLAEFEGVKFKEEQDFVGQTVERQFVTAIADVMLRRMEEDDSIVVMGEDIHNSMEAARSNERTKDAFPDQVLGTPISEAAFAVWPVASPWMADTPPWSN